MTNICNFGLVPPTFVYLNTPVTNVTGNGTVYVLKFDTTLYGSGYSSATGLYTVTVPGLYLIATSFMLTNVSGGSNGNLCTINSTLLSTRLSEYSLINSIDSSLRFCTCGMSTLKLAAGNTFNINVQVNNGSSASTGIGGGNSPYVSWMYIKYLG
jgi:hypothetical protein